MSLTPKEQEEKSKQTNHNKTLRILKATHWKHKRNKTAHGKQVKISTKDVYFLTKYLTYQKNQKQVKNTVPVLKALEVPFSEVCKRRSPKHFHNYIGTQTLSSVYPMFKSNKQYCKHFCLPYDGVLPSVFPFFSI